MAKDPEKSIFDNSIQYLTIITTVIVSVILLTLTLPPPNSVSLSSYSDGEVWGRKALIADEAFPLYKSEAEIKAQKDSIRKHFKPYFKINVSQVDSSLAIVSSKAKDDQFAQFPPAYINYIKEGIKTAYERGIVSANELNEAKSKGQTEINVALDKESNLYDIDSLFTPQTAYEYVMNRDSAHFKREILNAIFSEFDHDNTVLITPNIILNAEMSASQLNSRLAEVGETKSSVKKGEKIIDYGEVIDAEKKVRIDSYVRMINEKNLSSKEGQTELLVGRALFFLGLLLALGVFLYIFRRDILRNKRSVMLIFTLVTIFPLITHLLLLFQMLNVYLLPFAMVAIFMCIFFDARTAFMALLTTILISSLGLSNPYEFVLIEVVAGLTAIFTVSELTERSELLKITLYITIVSLVFSLVFDLAQGRQIHELQGAHYQYITGGGIMILCSYPLLYLLERVFGFNSQMTLIELMNINNDILSQLSQNAQGTFNHSMNVANLATDVAKKIGAKVQLVRCGAFYHDIGKMANPTFFTENQMGVNPHDAIADEKESAKIIISHVAEGVRIAKEHNLPKEIIDFILTHHGRGYTKYFYDQWRNKQNHGKDDIEAFTYPGPNPLTKEQAILMMSDAVEATARSLKDYTAKSIFDMVNRIVQRQIDNGYFKRCPISFIELELAKRTLIDSLKKMYHTRIAYPDEKPVEEAEKSLKNN